MTTKIGNPTDEFGLLLPSDDKLFIDPWLTKLLRRFGRVRFEEILNRDDSDLSKVASSLGTNSGCGLKIIGQVEIKRQLLRRAAMSEWSAFLEAFALLMG